MSGQGGDSQHRAAGRGQTVAAFVQAMLEQQKNKRQPGGHGDHIQVAEVDDEQVAKFKGDCAEEGGQGMECVALIADGILIPIQNKPPQTHIHRRPGQPEMENGQILQPLVGQRRDE